MRTTTIVALACVGAACSGARTRLPAARFAPRATWTPEAYALPTTPPSTPTRDLTRDEMIEDVAYLEHVLDEAFASNGAMTAASRATLRENFRDVPLVDRDVQSFCDALAEHARNAAMTVALRGKRCRDEAERPLEPLLAVPAGWNYAWRVDDDDHSKVGLLAVSRFADPADPGWTGIDRVLAELAKLDVVVVDVQDARGNDPRIALAIGLALGTDGVRPEWEVRPVTRDNAFARVARANHALRNPHAPPPRDRALWLSLATSADRNAVGREHFTGARTRPLGQGYVLWGNGCESACQLLVQLAEHHAPNDTAVGSTLVDNRLNGDEPGLVRLPHSGVEVTFPTVAYGPYAHRLIPMYMVGFAHALLGKAHGVAAGRADAVKFADGAPPSCNEIAVDPEAVRHKTIGCHHAQPGDGPVGAIVMLRLDSTRAREFFASCTDTQPLTAITHPVELHTIATISTTPAALARIASAPFVMSVSSDCAAQ